MTTTRWATRKPKRRVTEGIQFMYSKVKLPGPIDSEEECRLVGRWQQLGDIEARDKLVMHNVRFALTIAADFVTDRIEDTDLAQEAVIGLCVAADRFDPTTGYKFITYAVWWVRQRLQRFVDEHGRHVRVPVNKARMAWDIKRAQEQIAEAGRLPSVQEVAEMLGVTEASVIDVMGADGMPISLCTPTNSSKDGDLTVGDSIAWDGPSPEDDLYASEARQIVEDTLKELDPRMAQILVDVFGLDGKPAQTLEAVGQRMGVSRERVRQLREQAISILMKSGAGARLRALKGAA